MANPLNKISQIYLDQVAKINSDPELAKKEREKWQSEAKVDTGSAEEKATARNKRNTPAGKDYKFDTSVFITRKPGESLDSARTRKRREAHGKKRGVKEGFSDWRTDLREIVDETETEAEKKVKEKKVKNKVIINPKFQEALQSMGGTLLEVQEVADQPSEKEQEDATLRSKENRQRMLKKQVLLRKLQAVRSGGGHDIVASYDPIEGAVEYFYEEGINEEGFDQFIEEIGLEEFVDFVDGSVVELNEERAARKASVRAKSYEKVKAEVDKADAARKASKKGEYAPSYAKKETDVTDYGDDKPAVKKAPAKKPAPKPVAKKPAPKPAPKPVAKKVVKAVAKVKKTQPKKPASKEGLRDRIKSAYKAGVKRHRKATQGVRVFHKGMKAGAKKAVKFAKDVKKVVSEEELMEKDLSAAERRAIPNKDFALPGKGEGPKGKQAGSYPIPDEKHARSALSLVSQHGTPEEKAKVRAKVKKKFPNIDVSEAKVDTGSPEAKASARNVRNTPPGKDSKFDTSVFITRKPGESLDSARTRKRRDAHAAKRGVKEDKAFDNVVSALRKKHGESGVLTKDSPKPKVDKAKIAAERKKRQEADNKAFASRAKKAGYKNPQDYANVVARYGSEDNYKKGRGLD